MPEALLEDEKFMRLALDACRKGIDAGQSPFGACIARDGDMLSCSHNQVWASTDPTAHAEVQAIRDACRRLDTVHLCGATVYSTTEPCPMCFAAIHWARIERIVYAADIADAQRFGFNELPISNARMADLGGTAPVVVGGVLRAEAIELYRLWQSAGGRAY